MKTEEAKIQKVIRDGKVAVLYSRGYGAGWYTWNSDVTQCLFSPEIVALVEQGNKDEITDELCCKLFGVDYFYAGGSDGLTIEWLPEGTAFRIDEYDGAESIETLDSLTLVA
jgi:hypothetical protein